MVEVVMFVVVQIIMDVVYFLGVVVIVVCVDVDFLCVVGVVENQMMCMCKEIMFKMLGVDEKNEGWVFF